LSDGDAQRSREREGQMEIRRKDEAGKIKIKRRRMGALVLG
jgi:hypothetical protein